MIFCELGSVRHLVLTLLCCMLIGPVHAQSGEELDTLSREIDQRQQSGQYTEALQLVEKLSEAIHATFGETSGEYAAILARRAGLLQALGRYRDAEPFYLRAQVVATAVLGPEDKSVTFVLNDLAFLYRLQGRFKEAEPLYQRALLIRERDVGSDHPAVAHIISNLAALYVSQGRYREAEPLFTRALRIVEETLKPDDPEVGKNLNNLAILYWALGRFADAEPLYKRWLDIVESSMGSEHPAVSIALNNLANLYQDQGRHTEAEPLFWRSLDIREKALGPTHRDVGESYNALAWFHHQAQRDYSAAEPDYQRALGILEKVLGPGHATVGALLNNLAVLYYDQGRYAEAEPLLKRAMAVRQGALGAGHSDVGQTMYRLARLYHAQKRLTEALPLHQHALKIRSKAQGPEHPEVIQSLDGIAQVYEAQRNWHKAADAARRARDLVISRARKGALANNPASLETGRREIAQGREVFARLVRALWGSASNRPTPSAAALRESYLAPQWANQTEAGSALAQMSARQAKGSGRLSELVRERQDLAQQWQALDRQLYASIALSADQRSVEAERKLRDQLSALDTRRTEIDETLMREFPQHFALSSPEPVSVQASRGLLKPDEALLQFMVTESEVFIWAIAKSGVRWVRSKLGPKALDERVAALRCGLDDTAWNGEKCQGLLKASPRDQIVQGRKVAVLPFDLSRAHEVYATLLGPVEDLIRGKHLLIVSSGPLASLPPHVLVTKRPKTAILSRLADYRGVDWLGTRHSITVLPSVASLKALRRHAKVSHASKPYLGIGNPLLDGPQDDPNLGDYYKRQAEAARDKQRCSKRTAPQEIAMARGPRTRGFSSLFAGGRANISFLRRLTPLPATTDELCEIAGRLGVAESEILLGELATETRLKDLSEAGLLADYTILHFATHGALAGEVRGAAEPGLILTPPATGGDDSTALERDDGYLTVSEIAALKLDADWVVLSACNTAGDGGETSEPLSGLARAFFYAGTRALLVSHWAVDSDVAVKLTTRAFAEISANPLLGRAEALSISMRELVEKGTTFEAHPSQWAPFVVVGEGKR